MKWWMIQVAFVIGLLFGEIATLTKMPSIYIFLASVLAGYIGLRIGLPSVGQDGDTTIR